MAEEINKGINSPAEDLPKGRFGSLLTRNNKQLREDRAYVIIKDAEKNYRRKIEDLKDALDRLKTDRDNYLDINPGNTQTIINPTDFKSEEFIANDLKLGVDIRNTEIMLEIAEKRYSELFK